MDTLTRERRIVASRSTLGLAIAATLALAACGGSGGITGYVPPTTTTSSATPATSAFGSATTVPGATPTTAPTAGATTTAAGRAPVTGTWAPVTANLAGLKSECGNMSLLSARPDRDMLVVSIAQQGLFSSENGADSWSKLGQGGGSATITNRGSTIVYDPDHPNTFWESGIYNGNGVYRTDDNGVTFHQLGDVPGSDGVSVDLSDPARKTLLTGTHERSTIFRSSDGGATWTDVSKGLPTDMGFTTGPHVIDAQTYLMGTSKDKGSGIFRTTDGGATWTRVFQGGVTGVPLVSESDGAMYWVMEPYGGIVKSTDGGLTWNQVTRPGTNSALAWNLVELPDGRLAAVGNQVVIVSADKGATWKTVGPGMPFPPTGFAYSPSRKAFYVWYFGCDQTGDNPVADNAIVSLPFDYATQ